MIVAMSFSSFRRSTAVALLATSAVPATAQYIGGHAPPPPPPPAAGVIESPADSLSRAIHILAASPRDFAALMIAGRAELALGDLSAAAGFFGRADEVRPSDPAPKVGMGGALVQAGDARGALTWFGQAQSLGASPSLLGADRGLAHDLLGEQGAAQSDYRAALGGPMPDEARRRLALSLAIGGRMGEGLSTLQPLVDRHDAAAQRVRAFVLALGGQKVAAMAAIDQAMPGASLGIGRFFDILPRLSALQKAAAVHLGVFPTANEMALVNVVPAAPMRSAPTVTPPLSTRADRATASPRPRSNPLPSELTVAEPAPFERAFSVVRPTPRPAISYDEPTEWNPSVSQRSSSRPSHRTVRAKPIILTVEPTVALVEQPKPAPVILEPTVAIVEQPKPAPVVEHSSASPQPGFSGTVDVAVAVADRLSGIDRILSTSREPLQSVAGNTLPDPQPDAAATNDGKGARKLALRKAAADKKLAAARKAAADEKAAVKQAANAAAAAEKATAAKLGTPGDHWVQLAGGTNEARMATEFKRIKAKKPVLFAGRPGFVTNGKDYFRLLVGPFDDAEGARDYAAELAKAGIDGFSWPRTPPQIKIEKLPAK